MSWNRRTMGWVLEGLGLDMKSKLPDAGLPAKTIPSPHGQVIVFVRSVADKAAGGGFMRVMVVCPKCHDLFSVGRLPQHVGTKACTDNIWFDPLWEAAKAETKGE